MEIYNDTYCVYIHTNKIDGKKYVGQTVYGNNPNKRWKNGKGYKGSTYFYNAIKKYGWDNFEHEIVASNLTKEEADTFERLLIDKLDLTNMENGYNLETGGSFYKKISEETKKKISLANSGLLAGEKNPMYGVSPKERMDEDTYKEWRKKCTDLLNSPEIREKQIKSSLGRKYPDEVNKKKGRSGKEHPMYGKHCSDEVRQKMSEARKGKPIHTEESKRKISDATKGEKNPFYGKHHSEETRKKMSEDRKGKRTKEESYWYGKHLSAETKEKMRLAHIGKKASDEVKRKMSESHKGEKSHAATMVLQCDMQNIPICIFGYIEQATEKLNINRNCIGGCCRGDQKSAGGYKWFYVYDKTTRSGNVIQGAITLGYITEEEIQCLKF